jgi:hypothetical protein
MLRYQVLDDPKLLKKTLKRQEQEKKKSAKKWEDKLRLQGDVRTSKQDKRKVCTLCLGLCLVL